LFFQSGVTVKRICYYHAGCPDGFGAAWAVYRAWGNDARYVARGHEDRFQLPVPRIDAVGQVAGLPAAGLVEDALSSPEVRRAYA